jgi:hypothetical protein
MLLVEPTQPLTQCVSGSVSPVIKQPGHDADHSPPSSAKVKSGGAIQTLPICFQVIVLSLLNVDNFTFHFLP